MRWYFKKTWCGMVLMILKDREDDGRPYQVWEKASEDEAQEILSDLRSAIQKSKKYLEEK